MGEGLAGVLEGDGPVLSEGLGEQHGGEKAVRDQRRVTCPKGWLKSPRNFSLLSLQHKTGTNEYKLCR